MFDLRKRAAKRRADEAARKHIALVETLQQAVDRRDTREMHRLAVKVRTALHERLEAERAMA